MLHGHEEPALAPDRPDDDRVAGRDDDGRHDEEGEGDQGHVHLPLPLLQVDPALQLTWHKERNREVTFSRIKDRGRSIPRSWGTVTAVARFGIAPVHLTSVITYQDAMSSLREAPLPSVHYVTLHPCSPGARVFPLRARVNKSWKVCRGR